MLNNFFIIPLVYENARVKLVLAIPVGAPITVAKEIIDITSLVVHKAVKILSI